MQDLDIAISSISFLTLREKVILKKNIDSLEQLAVLSITDISKIIGRVSKSKWNGQDTVLFARKSLALMEAQKIQCARFDEADFPVLLREIPDMPYMVFWRGDLNALLEPCVSVVGTRDVIRECAEASFNFAHDAAEHGFTVVSGLANGIDAFAHKGTLSVKGGRTCAVLPTGIDTIVPEGHKALARNLIQAGGLLLSEYIPGTPAEPFRFVQRNRIIAALSSATIAVQAPCGSGTLITAQFALDYNRDLYVHESAFCEEARLQDEKSKKALRQKLSLAKNTSGLAYKLEHTLSSYVDEGAPIIRNFADFLDRRKES